MNDQSIRPISDQNWAEDHPVLVSVVVATYNHGPYIAQTIESILLQQTNFRVEVLVNDDASTDNTPEILKEYQNKFPILFRVNYQQENQYSKGVKPWFDILFPVASGKYIALCEGDDYWTDATKLQTQAKLLEMNPAYSLVAGGYKEIYEHNGEERICIKSRPNEAKEINGGFELTREVFAKRWYVHTLTVVFRREWVAYNEFKKYPSVKDAHLFFYLIYRGPGFYLTRELAAYRKHTGSVFGAVGRVNQLARLFRDYKLFYHFHPEDFLVKYRKILINILEQKTNDLNNILPKKLEVYYNLYLLIKTDEDFFEFCRLAKIKNRNFIRILFKFLKFIGRIR